MPTLAEALAIASQHHQTGQFEAADQICRQILKVDSKNAEALHLLGLVWFQTGNHELAVEYLSQAVEANSSKAVFQFDLGNVFQISRNLEKAADCYRRALELDAKLAEAHNNLGNVLKKQGKLEEAAACFRRALEIKPDYAEAHSNLGNALQAQGRLEEAIESYRRSMERNPVLPQVLYNLAAAFQAQWKLDDALTSYLRALELKPDLAEALNNIGTILGSQGKSDEAVPYYRRALELKPDFAEAWANLLFARQYQAGATLADLAATHAEFDMRRAAPLMSSWRPHDNDRNPERQLRLGFVSPDLGLSPVGCFLVRVLEHLDRGQCQTVVYSDRIIIDDLTKRFKAVVTVWRDAHLWKDTELAEQIRSDRIDILFDLVGHAPKNRLLVFARKPAPVQITWAGYAGTTGLKAMDYILADQFEIPPEAETYYSEHVLRMPDGYVCYDPPLYAPAVSSLPASKTGFVTFGSFNNRAKITSHVIDVWAKVLARLPQSRLVLKNKGMDDPSIANKLANAFAGRGIDPNRVECRGWSPHVDLLAEYNRLDLALDTFPYNGGLTTCEALWMGVPVITCPGETFAGRHSLTHLSNVGLTETIARDLQDYVELAVALGNDLPRLAALRNGLRESMAASALCDGRRFADNLLRTLRSAWREWCQNPAGDSHRQMFNQTL